MDLATYISDMARRRELAETLGTDPAYLWQIATNWRNRRASPEFARKIEDATGAQVTRYDLRPDIFGEPPTKPTQGRAA